jgi:hypothetical protein
MKAKYLVSIFVCLLEGSSIPLQAQLIGTNQITSNSDNSDKFCFELFGFQAQQTESNQTVNNAKFEAIDANADKGILYRSGWLVQRSRRPEKNEKRPKLSFLERNLWNCHKRA